MLGLSSKPKPLSIEQIHPVILNFVKHFDEDTFNLVSDKNISEQIELLSGTPHWTLIQILDNFWTSKYNPKIYRIHLAHERSLGISVLPSRFSDSLEFTKKFFTYSILIRPSGDFVETITKDAFKEQFSEDQANNLIKMIEHLQRFEIKEYNPFFENTKEDDELIDEIISNNEELANLYYRFRKS